MPTPVTHAFVALGTMAPWARAPWAGRGLDRPSRKFYVLIAICGMLPDVDVLWDRLLAPLSMWAHRGVTHSVAFAALTAAVVMSLLYRHVPRMTRSWWKTWGFFFLVTFSHPLLDMLTDGARGVALLAPFSNARFALAWQPVRPAKLGWHHYRQWSGVAALLSELVMIWLPVTAGLALQSLPARLRRRSPSTQTASKD